MGTVLRTNEVNVSWSIRKYASSIRLWSLHAQRADFCFAVSQLSDGIEEPPGANPGGHVRNQFFCVRWFFLKNSKRSSALLTANKANHSSGVLLSPVCGRFTMLS